MNRREFLAASAAAAAAVSLPSLGQAEPPARVERRFVGLHLTRISGDVPYLERRFRLDTAILHDDPRQILSAFKGGEYRAEQLDLAVAELASYSPTLVLVGSEPDRTTSSRLIARLQDRGVNARRAIYAHRPEREFVLGDLTPADNVVWLDRTMAFDHLDADGSFAPEWGNRVWYRYPRGDLFAAYAIVPEHKARADSVNFAFAAKRIHEYLEGKS